jgi:HTH-type transcriptional regulator / antitoxin HigA
VAEIDLPFDPEYAVPPGASLRATLEELGMTQAELAARADLSLKHVNQIAQGVAALTPETSLAFEKVTGVPARIWNQLEASYREKLARSDDRKSLSIDVAWLDELPIAELRRRGALSNTTDKSKLLQEVCRFFGVANRQSWERVWRQPLAAFRRAANSDTGAVATWLRLAERKAEHMECAPFDPTRFRIALREIRTLTSKDPREFEPTLRSICAQCGVAVVFLPEIKGAKCWGATRFVSSTKAVIQLSLRYKTDDHLWFSFFHEAGHLILHGKKGTFIRNDVYKDEAEQEANRFAETFLIPRQFEPRLRNLELKDISGFANQLGIAPGIVVGRLQSEGLLDWNRGNSMKQRFAFVD